VPQQPRHLLERRSRRELGDGVAGNRQLTALAVDVAQTRGCGNDSFQSAVDHVPKVLPLYRHVNVD
jgi:hypothetical protein